MLITALSGSPVPTLSSSFMAPPNSPPSLSLFTPVVFSSHTHKKSVSIFTSLVLSCTIFGLFPFLPFFGGSVFCSSKRAGMRGGEVHSLNFTLLIVLLLLPSLHKSCCSSLDHLKTSVRMDTKVDVFLPEISPSASPQPLLPEISPSAGPQPLLPVISPSAAPQPLLPVISPSAGPQPLFPLLAPSPLTPFTNNSVPKLSGQCIFNFSAVESMMGTTSIDCIAVFATYLANVVCCPQMEATLVVLIGQSSKDTNMLALNGTSAGHCLSDFEKILAGQGASDTLQQICYIRPANLTAGSCPVKDVTEFENTVDTSGLLAACGKIDLVNECCDQICQNAISEAGKKLANKAYDLSTMDGAHALSGQSASIDDCKVIVHRWLASKLDPSHAKDVIRGLSNCNNNKVCPLTFPNMSSVSGGCGNDISNRTACCNAMDSYVSHLQKQSFITNLQALNCAASLGKKLQKANITENIYNLCHIGLKDFSLQAGIQESGCLLPSLPSDVIFDTSSGVSFLCDLNDNIPALWPSATQVSPSSCNKTIKIPALPAAASGQSGVYNQDLMFHLLLAMLMVTMIIFL